MKSTLRVVACIFIPIITTLLLRLVIGIINLIFDSILDLFDINMQYMFDFSEMWWFWLISATLSLVAIIFALGFIEDIEITDK